jgi:hypothetical protein
VCSASERCRRRESNPHDLRRRVLSAVRIPFRHAGKIFLGPVWVEVRPVGIEPTTSRVSDERSRHLSYGRMVERFVDISVLPAGFEPATFGL